MKALQKNKKLSDAGRLQGPVWRRLSAADGPQALRAHGQLHLCVLTAIHHSHRTHWHHHWQSRWGHKHSHETKMPVFTEAGSDKSHQQNQSSNLLVHLSTLLPLSWGQSFLVPAESPFKILHKKFLVKGLSTTTTKKIFYTLKPSL